MARWLTIAMVALLPPAFAGAEQRSDAERQAEQAFQRGTRLFEAEDFLGAARQFEEAYHISPIASVHFNIARSYELAEMRELAAQHYRAFLDARAGNPERRQTVRQRLDELSEGLGWVAVTTEPPGATLFVDGQQRGISPAALAMTPGTHTIEARLEDSSETRTVEVGEAERAISIRLGAAPSVPSQADPDDYDPSGRRSSFDDTDPDAPVPFGDDGGGDDGDDDDRRGVRRLHHGFFWAGLALTVGSGIALAVVGTRLLDVQAEYNCETCGLTDDQEEALRVEGVELEVATTALWIVTGVVLAATVLFAIFTDWSRLRRHRGDAAWDPVLRF
jgi:tetratricopeptide (TPR) repeat protein